MIMIAVDGKNPALPGDKLPIISTGRILPSTVPLILCKWVILTYPSAPLPVFCCTF